jgi:uncharacterized protein YacL
MVVAAVAGWQVGLALAGYPPGVGGAEPLRYVLLLTLAGGALGLLVTPYLTLVPLRRLWAAARGADAPTLLGAGVGLLTGLLAAALAAFPVSLLPDPFGRWLPTGVAVLLAWLGVTVGALRKDDVLRALDRTRRPAGRATGGPATHAPPPAAPALLLDTSAVVDGRVLPVRQHGFLAGDLAVPHFVLDELQLLADSSDPARRQRGRRGLDLLQRLQREANLNVLDADGAPSGGPSAAPSASADELPGRAVDARLVRLARERRAALVTTDFNLQQVATLQGVPVLNVALLANALRSPLAPGDTLQTDVVQPGREQGQGIGFVEDGTMVVVEGGRHLLGARVTVEVTRVLPTAAGRIIFGRPRDAEPAPGAAGQASEAVSEGAR